VVNVISEWAESHFPLYAVDSLQSLYGTSNKPTYNIHEGAAALIAIAGGEGALQTVDQTYALKQGSVMVLPANCPAVLTANVLRPLHAYKLSIGVRTHTGAVPADAVMRNSDAASPADILYLAYEPEIVAHVEELYIHRLPAHEVRHVQNQIIFHQTLLQLLKLRETGFAADEQPSMERSIAYLEENYGEKITSDQLAAIAGVSRSHYSILFKQLTGFSPNAYLSRLRVHRAKELLIEGDDTLREIALKVGYKDEFYLSRRFKQHTGSSPSGYSRDSLRRVAVLLAPYASHLMLLGVEPAVAISESSEYLNAEGLAPPQSMKFISATSSAEQVNSALIEADIELLIAAREHLDELGLNIAHLRAAAPVVEISWMKLGWKEHLRLIARVVGRSDRAERWLVDFEREERSARSLVQRSVAENEVITIVVIKPDQLLVYGARNVGYAIYQSLGLRPPALIEEQMKQHGDEFHSVPVDISELVHYAGTRLLVVVFPDEKGSSAHAERVYASASWKKLEAVRNNCVILLDRDEWVPYNPVSITLQLRRATALFSQTQ